jgi:hypothetical protein
LRLTQKLLNKKIGVRLTRVLRATQAAPIIEKAAELQKEMTHSAATQKTYIRRAKVPKGK